MGAFLFNIKYYICTIKYKFKTYSYMILVNLEEKKLSKAYKERLLAEIGVGRQVEIIPELLTKHETNVPGEFRIIKPSGTSVLLDDTLYGVIKWTDKWEIDDVIITEDHVDAQSYRIHWCTRVNYDTNGKFKDTFPDYDKGTGILMPKDVEKYWFFSRISRRIRNSANAKANRSQNFMLHIVDPAGDATKKISNKKAKAKVEYLLTADETEGGWNAKTLEAIARQLFLNPEQYKTTDLLKDAILSAAEQDERAKKLSGIPTVFGYNFILDVAAKKGDDYAPRESVSIAIQKRFVKHDIQREAWVLVNPGAIEKDDTIIGNICACDNQAPIKQNVLMAFLKHNPEILEKIETMIKPAAKKTKATATEDKE